MVIDHFILGGFLWFFLLLLDFYLIFVKRYLMAYNDYIISILTTGYGFEVNCGLDMDDNWIV